ncbi:MAG: aldo/keto reductase [Clostridium sp.]|uniref:aldo/keto reductase n=1 Tax=Clostridium sp. TaxID=1506 RepID=UPI0030387279
MIYRKLGRTNLDASVIGLGGEWLNGLNADEVNNIINIAIDNGVNILDVFMPQAQVRTNIGLALKGRREKMIIQGHLCTVFEDEQYTRTRDINKTKASFEDLLSRLQTDYIDIGMIHYVDSNEDFDSVFNTEIIEYAKELKASGRVKFLGMSSHNPEVALRAINTGLIDVLMFSINAAYDLEKSNTDIFALMDFKGLNEGGWTVDSERVKLYSTCENLGIGITVMKALAAGSLLKDETSPFGKAMTVEQCCHYCLTRPGVVSVLVGCHTIGEMENAVSYLNATDGEKDYSEIISKSPKFKMAGRCMYCNHCQPCPAKIDIAAVTKYLHLAEMQSVVPKTVKEHYNALKQNAKDCIQCGLCEPNCPFGVEIRKNMKKAQEVFKDRKF